MTEFWIWFKSFFSEETGASTTRLLNWIWTFTLCFGIIFVMAFVAIKTKEPKLPEIPTSYITLTGLFLAAKVGQRIFGENTETTSTTVTAPPTTTVTTTVPTPPNPAVG